MDYVFPAAVNALAAEGIEWQTEHISFVDPHYYDHAALRVHWAPNGHSELIISRRVNIGISVGCMEGNCDDLAFLEVFFGAI